MRKFSSSIRGHEKKLLRQEWLQSANLERSRLNSLLNILFQYSPGIDVDIEQTHDVQELISLNLAPELRPTDDNHYLRLHFKEKKVSKKFLQRTLQILKSIESKLPSFWCFGLHEWAMQYHTTTTSSSSSSSSSKSPSSSSPKTSSFQSLPLRVTPQQIEALINPKLSDDSVSVPRLRCTHFDAIRFFTPSALPLNTISPSPTRSTVEQFDQPGCIHVNMDLFKWAIKLHPLIPSSLLIDSLEIAIRAREIDMRASPYDLTAYKGTKEYPNTLGPQFSSVPIFVETPAGRKQYQQLQEEIYRQSIPIRSQLIDYYQRVLSKLESKDQTELVLQQVG